MILESSFEEHKWAGTRDCGANRSHVRASPGMEVGEGPVQPLNL